MSRPDETEFVYCRRCYRPHVFEVRPGLQYRDCACGGIVSMFVKVEPSRWRLLEVDK